MSKILVKVLELEVIFIVIVACGATVWHLLAPTEYLWLNGNQIAGCAMTSALAGALVVGITVARFTR